MKDFRVIDLKAFTSAAAAEIEFNKLTAAGWQYIARYNLWFVFARDKQ